MHGVPGLSRGELPEESRRIMLFSMNPAERAARRAGPLAWRLSWLVALALVALAPSARAGDPPADDSAGSWFDDDASSEAADAQHEATTSDEASPPSEDAAPAGEASSAGPGDGYYQDTDPSALTDFNAVLDPDGTWADHPTYGRVWVPDRQVVGVDFKPYVTGGHWGLDSGSDWVWVSDYPFGWVVFHYGRWVWTSSYGWAWIPGRRYAPAWVTWRVSAGSSAYIGWAPAPPSYIWRNGVAVSLWSTPSAYYVFVPSRRVFAPRIGPYVVRHPRRVRSIAGQTRRYDAHRYGRVGPPPTRARIPAQALPRSRVVADARARRAARPPSSPRSPLVLRGSSRRIAPASASVRRARGVTRAAAPRRPATTPRRAHGAGPPAAQRSVVSVQRFGAMGAPRGGLRRIAAPRRAAGSSRARRTSARAARPHTATRTSGPAPARASHHRAHRSVMTHPAARKGRYHSVTRRAARPSVSTRHSHHSRSR